MAETNLQALKEGNKPAAPKDFPAMLQAWLPQIKAALPAHLSADRMARIALTAFRKTPALAKCDPKSVFGAVLIGSQLGLEIGGPLAEAHLIPYKTECQLIPDYKGLMKLVYNTGLVTDIYAYEVREHDKFEIVYGVSRKLIHEPLKVNGFRASDDVRGNVVGFYAVAVFKDGTTRFEDMSIHDVNKIRDNSPGYKAAKLYKKESVWDTDYISMGKKTVIRRICKYLPKSAELTRALELDDRAYQGKEQKIDLESVINGSYAVVEDDDETVDPQTGEITAGVAQVEGVKNPPTTTTTAAEKVAAAKPGETVQVTQKEMETISASAKSASNMDHNGAPIMTYDQLLAKVMASKTSEALAEVEDLLRSSEDSLTGTQVKMINTTIKNRREEWSKKAVE